MKNRKRAEAEAINFMKHFARGILERTDVAAAHRDDLAMMVAINAARACSNKELESLSDADNEVCYQAMLGLYGKCRQTIGEMLQPASMASH